MAIAEASDVEDKKQRSPRRRLSEAEKDELARLYGETDTPLAEIRQRFGIAPTVLYRVMRERGVPLRGRTTASRSGATKATRTSRTETVGRRPRQVRFSRSQPAPPATNGLTAYRVLFRTETTVTAADIHDALRQAERIDSADITAIVAHE